MEFKESTQLADSILSHLPLSPDEMEILAENGFDDLDSLRFLDIKTLVALGVSEPEDVFKAVQEILSQYQEEDQEDEGGNTYEYDEQQQLGGEVEQEALEGEMENGDQQYHHHQGQDTKEVLNIQVKQPKVITQAMIVQILQQQQAKLSNSGGAQYNKTMRGSNMTQALQKLTHLHLDNKRISKIGDEMQTLCKNLKVVYLFDNIIRQIEGLQTLKNLIQLSLYNNQIVKIEGLEGLGNLRKLYLEKNRIERLEGLTNCRQLEELYLSHQEIHTDFTFDEYSLAAVAGSLRYLDLSDSRVRESLPLYYLERLEVLILKRNRIQDFEEQVCPMLQTMASLQQFDLSDNPVNLIPKYRDQIIILTGNRLQEIDGKKVTQQERTYLMQLVQRKQRQVIGQSDKKEEFKKGGNFEISGKNKQIHQQSDQYGYPTNVMMTGTGGGAGYLEGEDTQNQFYSPLDEGKQVLKQRTNIANPSYQSNAYMKKRSINLNSNTDFTAAGVSHMPTKHIPAAATSKLGGQLKKQ